jgi:hypothetical protein
MTHPSGGKVLMFAIVSLMIGICAAAATYKFTVMFAVPLIAAALGTVVSFVLIRQVTAGLMA